MLSILLAALGSQAAGGGGGGGGGGAFSLTSASAVNSRNGSSCGTPAQWTVGIVYAGSPSGVTLKLEIKDDTAGGTWVTHSTGLAPTSFPIVVDMEGYYNKFAAVQHFYARVTNEADAGDTVTSDDRTITAIACD